MASSSSIGEEVGGVEEAGGGVTCGGATDAAGCCGRMDGAMGFDDGVSEEDDDDEGLEPRVGLVVMVVVVVRMDEPGGYFGGRLCTGMEEGGAEIGLTNALL